MKERGFRLLVKYLYCILIPNFSIIVLGFLSYLNIEWKYTYLSLFIAVIIENLKFSNYCNIAYYQPYKIVINTLTFTFRAGPATSSFIGYLIYCLLLLSACLALYLALLALLCPYAVLWVMPRTYLPASLCIQVSVQALKSGTISLSSAIHY